MVVAGDLVPNNLPHLVSNGRKRSVDTLMETAPTNLLDLVVLYLRTYLEGAATKTFQGRAKHLQHFLTFYTGVYHHLDPKEWYVATTRAWIREQQRDKRVKPGTIATRYVSVRHFARWAHRTLAPSPFPLGLPTEGVKPPEEPKYRFAGLTRKNVLRLMAAADTLSAEPGRRGSHTGNRDRAFLHVALATGLRVSELIGLDSADYDAKKPGFRNIIQKGGTTREYVKLWYPEDHKAALLAWLQERGDFSGPLFCTRTLRPLTRKQAWHMMKRMEQQANAHLPEEEHFTVTPHALRHTLLRRITEDARYGIHMAMAASGHKSDKYIWTYTQPSDDELEELE